MNSSGRSRPALIFENHNNKSAEYSRIRNAGACVTTRTVLMMKKSGEKIAMLTAYDYLLARLLDEVGVDVILVGDSLGNVIQGHETTLPVTVDDMIYHAKAVKRGVRRPSSWWICHSCRTKRAWTMPYATAVAS